MFVFGGREKKIKLWQQASAKSKRGASDFLLYRNARRLAGWGRCCRWGAAIKAEICDRCCHKQDTGTFHLSMPMCDLPRVHSPGAGLFVALAIRTTHIRQARASKAGEKNKNKWCFILFQKPTAQPTFVSVTQSGTMMERHYLKADIFVQ